jgi:hypothetical protein
MAFVTKPTVDLPDDYRVPEKPSGERLKELNRRRQDLTDARERRKRLQQRQRLPKDKREFECPSFVQSRDAKYRFDSDKCYWVASCPNKEVWIWDEVTNVWVDYKDVLGC